MEKRHKKFLIAFAAAWTLFLTGLIVFTALRKSEPTPIPESMASNPTLKPTPKDEKVIVSSPDGKLNLQMVNEKQQDRSIIQTFTIISGEEEPPVEVYKSLSEDDSLISIPFNAFSPNNKYLFLKYEGGQGPKRIVIRTDGENIKGDEKSVEIEKSFYEKYPDFKITDVTGWGGYSVIVVNTDNKEGTTGPSWWFDMSNFSFVRLSTRFN
jgi:hypothetical protein